MPLPAQFFPVLSESAGEPVVLARRGTAAREVSAPPLLGGECLSAGRWRADGSVSASRLAATIIPAQGRIPQRVDLRIDAHSEYSFVHVRAIRQPEMMSGSSHVRGVRIMRRVRRFPSRAALMRNSTTNIPAAHFDRHRGCGAFAGASLRPQRAGTGRAIELVREIGRRAEGHRARPGSRSASANPFEFGGHPDDLRGHLAKFLGIRAVLRGGAHVLGGAAQLEQPVLQIRDLTRREHHRILRQTGALHRPPAFVGPLAARLRAVQPGPALPSGRSDPAAAPRAVPVLASGRTPGGWILRGQALHGA